MNTRTWIIFTIPTAIFLLLVAILNAIPTQAGTPNTIEVEDTVPINGLAYWGVDVTGQGDFDAVYKVPFQAADPTVAVWEETQRQNARFSVPSLENLQVSASGVVSGASHTVNDFSEVMLSIDPTDPNHLLGASKFFYIPTNYLFYTGVFESFDGGLNWSQVQPNGVEDYTLTSDPVTTFDDEGNGYFTLLTRNTGGYTGLDMLKKPVGSFWQAPVTVNDTTSTDKQWIIGDQNPQGTSPYAGNLYMSWTSFGGVVTGIAFSRSTDGNQTWSFPISLASGDIQGSVPGVGPDGTVYVVYGRGIFSTGSGTLEIRKSTNGGQSFGSTVIAANISPIPYYLPNNFNYYPNFRTPASLPAFAVSPVDGNLYLAWADYRNGDADIYFTRSTDSGATWQTPYIRLNDDPISNGIDQFQPQISIAPNGRVAVMWFDRRLDCPNLPWIPANHVGVSNACIDTFMTRSFDEGATWVPNIRASAQTWDWTLNLPITSGADGFIGDYQGIASNDDYDFPFWNATANLGENAENYQEIFVARVPLTIPLPVDLSASFKLVTPTVALPSESLTYSIGVRNTGPGAANVTLSDPLPENTSFVPGSMIFPGGTGAYLIGTHTISWTGVVSANVPVDISFQVVISGVSNDVELTNTVFLDDGAGTIYERTATAEVRVAPYLVSTFPEQGAISVPITSPVFLEFSEPILISSLVISSTPLQSTWDVSWNLTHTVVTLTHPVLAYAQPYTITVSATDESGNPLVPGPVSNPWQFTTENESVLPPEFKLYLPIIHHE